MANVRQHAKRIPIRVGSEATEDVSRPGYGDDMEQVPKLTAADMEQMSPDERAQAVRSRQLHSLDQLDPGFRERVVETGRKLLKERGLLDVEQP